MECDVASSKPRDLGSDRGYRAIAATGRAQVVAEECDRIDVRLGVEVAGIMRAMRLVETKYETP